MGISFCQRNFNKRMMHASILHECSGYERRFNSAGLLLSEAGGAVVDIVGGIFLSLGDVLSLGLCKKLTKTRQNLCDTITNLPANLFADALGILNPKIQEENLKHRYEQDGSQFIQLVICTFDGYKKPVTIKVGQPNDYEIKDSVFEGWIDRFSDVNQRGFIVRHVLGRAAVVAKAVCLVFAASLDCIKLAVFVPSCVIFLGSCRWLNHHALDSLRVTALISELVDCGVRVINPWAAADEADSIKIMGKQRHLGKGIKIVVSFPFNVLDTIVTNYCH